MVMMDALGNYQCVIERRVRKELRTRRQRRAMRKLEFSIAASSACSIK
jgi:hypothetical protein